MTRVLEKADINEFIHLSRCSCVAIKIAAVLICTLDDFSLIIHKHCGLNNLFFSRLCENFRHCATAQEDRSGAKVRKGGEYLQKSHGHWQQIKHTFSTTSANTHHSFIKKNCRTFTDLQEKPTVILIQSDGFFQLSSKSVYPPRAQPARNLNFDLWRTKVPHDLIVFFDTHNGSHRDLSLLGLSQLSQQSKDMRTNQIKKRRKGRRSDWIRHNKKHLFITDASSLILVYFCHFLFVKLN